MREAQETENEERYDAVGGETSSEGAGRGLMPKVNASEFENRTTADACSPAE